MKRERRSVGSVELRAGKDKKHITGLGAVYYDGTPDTEYQLGPEIVERVHAGAFDAILENRSDVFALYHHREDMMLGRRSAGTLTLKSTDRGLAYSIPIDNSDPIHQTVAARIRRREVRGSSVTWLVNDSGQSYDRRSDGMIVRNIYRVEELADVGPTHLPCYSATSAEMRSRDLSPDELEELLVTARSRLLDPPTPAEIYDLLSR